MPIRSGILKCSCSLPFCSYVFMSVCHSVPFSVRPSLLSSLPPASGVLAHMRAPSDLSRAHKRHDQIEHGLRRRREHANHQRREEQEKRHEQVETGPEPEPARTRRIEVERAHSVEVQRPACHVSRVRRARGAGAAHTRHSGIGIQLDADCCTRHVAPPDRGSRRHQTS